jgi:hypothetical protein
MKGLRINSVSNSKAIFLEASQLRQHCGSRASVTPAAGVLPMGVLLKGLEKGKR